MSVGGIVNQSTLTKLRPFVDELGVYTETVVSFELCNTNDVGD